MSEDNTYKFVCKLFNDYNYNGSQWEIDAQIDGYYNFLKAKENETGKEYNYDKMYQLIEREYKYKTIPSKNLLADWQKRCVVYNYDTSKDGELVLVLCYMTSTDGHYELRDIREYTMWNRETTKKSEKEVLFELKKIYDEVVIKHYKKGSNLIGNTVFIPKTYNEMGEVTEYEQEKVA